MAGHMGCGKAGVGTRWTLPGPMGGNSHDTPPCCWAGVSTPQEPRWELLPCCRGAVWGGLWLDALPGVAGVWQDAAVDGPGNA